MLKPVSEQVLTAFPVFSNFRWQPPSFETDRNVNMIGAVARNSYMPRPWFQELNRIEPGEDVFEWVDILEAIEASGETFTMAYLGAGYGRWIVNAARAARQKGKTLQLIAVEAEPTHAAWLSEHLRDNDISSSECQIFDCALTADGRNVVFTTGHANEWYGQSVVSAPNVPIGNWPSAAFESIPSKTLHDVLSCYSLFDIVASDIQGLEMEVFCSSMNLLNQRAKRVHIGTHGDDIEHSLRRAFTAAGWEASRDFSSRRDQSTPFGMVKFQDGIQSWLNPQFVD